MGKQSAISKFVNNLKEDLNDIDPITWAENNLRLDGKKFKITGTGRDYLYEIYNYIAFELPRSDSIPMVMLKSRKVEMSTTATVLALWYLTSGVKDNITFLHTFPQIDGAERYSNSYFDKIVKGAKKNFIWNKKRDKIGKYSVTLKQFVNNNQIFIEGASNEANRLRNIAVDFTIFDEIQDILLKARGNIREAMSTSRFGPAGTGMEINFGTPKEANTDFQRMWEDSDQRYYHLKCLYCEELFGLTIDNFIHGFMVECLHCHELQDKRKAMMGGKWIATRTQGDILYRGYFLNQLYIPHYTRESIDRKKKDYAREPQTFANEVMGEFWSGATYGLSFNDVYNHCVEVHGARATQRSFATHIFPTEKRTYMGIDWGGKIEGKKGVGGQSFTVITIVSKEPDGKIMLEYTERVDQEGLTYLIDRVRYLWRTYSITECVADIGYGHVEVQELQKIFGDKVKSCYFSAQVKATYKYNRDLYMITVNRDRVIEEVIEGIKANSFIFPYADPQKVEWAMQHVCSMIVSSKTIGGTVRRVFEKGNKPNDFLMTLIYAYIALKYQATSGFTQHTGDVFQRRGFNMPKPVGAHIFR